MATHDYVIANASGAAVRADLNNALAAIVSNNSGSSEPGTTYAFQWWADTNASQLKLRNAANDDWVVIQELDGTLLMENGTVGSPGLAFASDTDTGLFRPAANQLAIATNGIERVEFGTTEVVFNDGGNDIDLRVEGDTNANLFLVDAGNDRVNIGGTIQVAGSRGGSLQPSDNDSLELFTSATSGDANTGCGLTFFNHDGSGSEMGGTIQVAKENGTDDNTASYMRFATRTNGSAAAERVRIDSEGRLLVGTSSDVTGGAGNAVLQARTTGGAQFILARNDGAVVAADDIGKIIFISNAGAASGTTAEIMSQAEATLSSSSKAGRLVFSTTTSGATTAAERMRIDGNGNVIVGKTTTDESTDGIVLGSGGLFTAARSDSFQAIFNRNGSDGELIVFRHANASEGGISISGSTVSYNGAHLSRWSQLAGGAERVEILRGSVLSNLDEMCEWSEENNEQLNRMKVSDVEGDANVSGVFQAWDDDDDTYLNDFYCAMTGDFVIRIAKGTTVERGDLLMSAGDGTAKPQDDDIVRSKTIAKVTSTKVSTTYSDGSFCVPCVLMAC